MRTVALLAAIGAALCLALTAGVLYAFTGTVLPRPAPQRASSVAPPVASVDPSEKPVCAGAATTACTLDAARRARVAVAWIPDGSAVRGRRLKVFGSNRFALQWLSVGSLDLGLCSPSPSGSLEGGRLLRQVRQHAESVSVYEVPGVSSEDHVAVAHWVHGGQPFELSMTRSPEQALLPDLLLELQRQVRYTGYASVKGSR